MRFIYTILFWLALPWMMLRLLWRAGFSQQYPYCFRERCGFSPKQFDHCIWVHAVSLGETIAATPLIRALRAKYPHETILITNTTATGRARTLAVFQDQVEQCAFPYDLPRMINRFLDRVKPRILIVMETELWPNLFAACQKRKIPIVLANARLSEKSARGYQRIGTLTREMLSAISALAAQAEPDAERFIQLGMPKERIQVTGNLKFDLEVPNDLMAKGATFRTTLGGQRLIWVAASTHPGEDEIMLRAHSLLRAKFPDALLVLVPRHPERFDAVAALLHAQSFSYVRRSEDAICDQNTTIYLADSVGEMMLMFAACDVACVAGSFVQVGGHNIIEPAALHKPVITGPVMFNFASMSQEMVAAGGMFQVQDAEALSHKLMQLFSDEILRHDVGEKAFQVVEKNRGALQRQVAMIEAKIFL